jgi:hypothetical protein
MEFDLLTLVGVSVGLMFFGYFFGLFEGRGQGAKKARDEETAKRLSQPTLPPPSPPVAPVENNLLALSFDEKNQPQIKLDGQRVDASQLSPENRKRLIDLMLMMRPWIDTGSGQKQVPSMQPVQSPQRPVAIATASIPAPLKPSPQKVGVPITVPAPIPEPAPTSMVAQIDAILQSRLIGTPLEDIVIRLTESAKGDPIVLVGDKSYAGVGEVTDPAVQAAIRAAIAEWERKYTPGYK